MLRRGIGRRTGRRAARRTARRAGRRPRRAGPSRRGLRRPAGGGLAQGLQRRKRRRRILVGGAVLLAAGGAAYGAYKLSQRDADRIQEVTGVPPEELTDEELERAMADLEIEGIELDEEDYQALDATPPPEAAGSYLDELERLAALRDQGVVTEEEFQAKKGQLLGL